MNDAQAQRAGDPLNSAIAHVSADRIVVHGMDLTDDLIGKVDLGDMAFLELKGRLPTEKESRVFNAILVSLVEHGLTPSAIVARLTMLGAPEALQGSVAAGLIGLGDRFGGSMEGVASMLQGALPLGSASEDLESIALETVAEFRRSGRHIPGLGHRSHKGGDPRAKRLFTLAQDCGLAGPYVTLMSMIHAESERQFGRSLPLNATGAIGALSCELELPWRIVRGLGVMARAIGLVGHLLEELSTPIANEINLRAMHDVHLFQEADGTKA